MMKLKLPWNKKKHSKTKKVKHPAAQKIREEYVYRVENNYNEKLLCNERSLHRP